MIAKGSQKKKKKCTSTDLQRGKSQVAPKREIGEVSMVRRRRRRRLASPIMPLPAPAPPLDNDDLLREILLLLPPQPSSLLRASVVCKRWRRLVSDPRFLRRFRAHHRRPPLLGCFSYDQDIGYVFTPTLDPPDRIPAARFSLPQRCRDEGGLDFVECHHGLALFLNKKQPEAVVWNPISGHQHRVAFPPEFGDAREREILCAAVLCAAGDDDPGHVHGDCGLSSFKLALVRGGQDHASLFVCLYKSKSGLWGNVISTTKDWYTLFYWRKSSVLIGNALYWWCCQIEGCILEFDFKMQKLVTIEKPVDGGCSNYQIMRTEESSLGLIILTELTMQLWERKVSSDDVATWVLQKTIELTKHLWPRQSVQVFWTRIHGYEEDHNVIFLGTSSGSFMIQLDSMQFNNRFQFKSIFTHFPYTSFYAADWAAGGRDDGTEM
ncbi:uncharacterized protein [Triticum aestivum]|nr:uncharacterized protein LOC123112641 [Triticum aestivum]